MPRVLVQTDDSNRSIVLNEQVNPEHLDTGHSAEQLIERLAWGIEDAARAERAFVDALSPRSYLNVSSG
jgi:hypothetical protein